MLKSDGELLGKPDEILRVILRWTSIQGGVVTLLVASCQGDRDRLRLGGLSLNTDFAFDRGMIWFVMFLSLFSISPLGNGKVEYSEFEDMMASQIGEPMTGDDLKYYFKKFDTNGDGFITSDELGLVMKTFGGKTYSKKEIDDMIKEADTDSDGKVSYAGTSWMRAGRTFSQPLSQVSTFSIIFRAFKAIF